MDSGLPIERKGVKLNRSAHRRIRSFQTPLETASKITLEAHKSVFTDFPYPRAGHRKNRLNRLPARLV